MGPPRGAAVIGAAEAPRLYIQADSQHLQFP